MNQLSTNECLSGKLENQLFKTYYYWNVFSDVILGVEE